MKRAPLRRKIRRAIGSSKQRENFKRTVLRRAGGECFRLAGDHDGPLQAHHVIAQQALKRTAIDLKLSDDETAALLWEPDNGMALCERHHRRHTLAVDRIPQDELPTRALMFASAWRLEHLISRYYPRREPDAA